MRRCLSLLSYSSCKAVSAEGAAFQLQTGHRGYNASICQRSLDIPFQASSRDRLQTRAIPWQQRGKKKMIWNKISHSLCTFNCAGSSFPPQTLQICSKPVWGCEIPMDLSSRALPADFQFTNEPLHSGSQCHVHVSRDAFRDQRLHTKWRNIITYKQMLLDHRQCTPGSIFCLFSINNNWR